MKKNRILYFSVFALSLIFVYFYGGKIPHMLFFATLVMPVCSFLYTLVVYVRFKYKQDLDKRLVVKGEKVKFDFTISNEDFLLYPYITVTFYGSQTIFAKQFLSKSFSLLPFQSKVFSLELECKYRGSYEIGIQSIEIEDFLGIFKLRYKVFNPRDITVMPRVVKIDRFHFKTDFMSESQSILNSRQEDMTTMLDIRKYAYGDNLRRIHWKLTSKYNEIMVKRFQNTCETSATFILDLNTSPYSVEQNTIIDDKVIEAVVSLVYFCLESWIPVNLVIYEDKLVNIDGKNPLDFSEIYRVLSKVKFNQSINIEDILEIYTSNTLNKNNILIFSSNVNYNLYNQIHKLSYSGYNLGLIYVSPEDITGVKNEDTQNILSFLPEIGVSAYKIDIEDDIKYVLEK